MEAIKPGLGTIVWMTFAFSIVFYILAKYAWRPIMSALKERERSIGDALEAARLAKEEMTQLKADNEKIVAEARAERDKIVMEARELKISILEDARQQASEESKKIIESAKQAIRNEREMAVKEMKEQLVDLSVEIAGKVLHQKLSYSVEQQELIEKSLRDIKLN